MIKNSKATDSPPITKERTCSRCGKKFQRVNEFSLFGYKQCLPCDMKMLEVTGRGEPWPERDDKVDTVQSKRG